jgi:hypothetical protein
VRENFPQQVAICRATIGRRTKCLLVVITDADRETFHEREQTLHRRLDADRQNPLTDDEPVIILVPKWQIETWVKCLIGQTLEEEDKTSDQPPVTSEQLNEAVEILYRWTRPHARIPDHCLPSLRAALPRLQRLES